MTKQQDTIDKVIISTRCGRRIIIDPKFNRVTMTSCFAEIPGTIAEFVQACQRLLKKEEGAE